MITQEKNSLRFYQFECFDPQAVEQAIFTRQGGVSLGTYASLNLGGTCGDDPVAVRRNHELVFDAIERPFESRLDVWQVHGKHIMISESPRPVQQKHQPADGVFTSNPEVTLMMRFADCVPLVFHDPVKKVVGIVHGGWQGTMLKIAQEAVTRINEHYGSDPADLVVGIGPSICGKCYEVGEEVRKQFLRSWGEVANNFFEPHNQRYLLDLWAANEWVLRQAGVTNIERSNLCTAEHLDEWYSYRKEKGATGRFGVVIALKRD
jgi:YfiH family protein